MPEKIIVRVVSVCHVVLIVLSNVLVQYPFKLFGFQTTWGAFTYPAIFILTDLTLRIWNASAARRIVLRSMLPGLLLSYAIATLLEGGSLVIHMMPLRIALACFVAYVMGQGVDILVFQRYRLNSTWWVAPVLSSTIGNVVDTAVFFFIAFYQCNNVFLSQHWTEIALVDVGFKIMISLIAFVPLYGAIIKLFGLKLIPGLKKNPFVY